MCDEESLQSSYLAENIEEIVCRVQNHLKAILSYQPILEFILKEHQVVLSDRSNQEFVLK